VNVQAEEISSNTTDIVISTVSGNITSRPVTVLIGIPCLDTLIHCRIGNYPSGSDAVQCENDCYERFYGRVV
jgi:hypothetical protein